MYITFTYKDGSNPYIAINNDNLFRMICKYDTIQETSTHFMVIGRKSDILGGKKRLNYSDKREILSDFAKELQTNNMFDSWGSLADWGAFFEEYGKKYGLLREFRENGII